MPNTDPTSLANSEKFQVKHLSWKIEVDFNVKVLRCLAALTFECLDEGESHLILDSKDLNIKSTHFVGLESPAEFFIGNEQAPFGYPVHVKVPSNLCKRGASFTLNIEYETSPSASALQWLNPEQTAGKTHPYLFTQCQAIHARSILPCQDTPSVKITYDAEVTVSDSLTALMSAVKGDELIDNKAGTKVCKFQQKVPIPSYLIALVVGALENRKVGPRSHVWAEKEMVDVAAKEFSETENMLSAGEKLLGDYVWGAYDLLILPPSFPYGGMENPCLTFCTPTIVAGDGSLTSVVAHEIGHSWTGNLVTNRNWEHFWLNEGFTRFVEAKIIGSLKGEKIRQFHAIGGWKDLMDAVAKFGKDSPLTLLVPQLRGIDPDDAFSAIPYEKGFAFLYYIESLVGGPEVFDVFLRTYIDKFKYKTVITDDFKAYLYDYFKDKPAAEALAAIDWESWLTKPGMPPVDVINMYDTSLANACKSLAQRWANASSNDLTSFSQEDIKQFSPLQIVEFLSLLLLEEPLSLAHLHKLHEFYGLSHSQNSEIRFRWLRLCIKSDAQEYFPDVVKFLLEQGRMKFVRPLYRELFKNIHGKDLAVKTFQENRKFYHRICEIMIAKDLEL